ncbi:NUDIX hydrolase [Mesorhizobium sp. M0778]|uniref:NUDIX hydrolase n=1 Tax=Mesorhizobium sp. M0778 TaxID=2956999 RepID=UPI00333AEB1D
MSQKTGRLLLQERSPNVQHPHTWATIGGAIETGSNPLRTAADELLEETGFDGPIRFEALSTFRTDCGRFSYQSFLGIVDQEFEPWHSREGSRTRWIEYGDWPIPLHFGLKLLVENDDAMSKIRDFIVRGRRGENLLAAQTMPVRTLYHCLNRPLVGNSLRPTYVLDGTLRLFAASVVSKAAVFAFDYHRRNEIVFNGPIEGTPDEFCLVYDCALEALSMRGASIYSFQSEGFESCRNAPRQWITTRELPIDSCMLAFQTKTVDDLMRLGVQVFSLNLLHDQVNLNHVLSEFTSLGPIGYLRKLTLKKMVIWENLNRGINPNAVLLERIC